MGTLKEQQAVSNHLQESHFNRAPVIHVLLWRDGGLVDVAAWLTDGCLVSGVAAKAGWQNTIATSLCARF
jgi:hypothetical protein